MSSLYSNAQEYIDSNYYSLTFDTNQFSTVKMLQLYPSSKQDISMLKKNYSIAREYKNLEFLSIQSSELTSIDTNVLLHENRVFYDFSYNKINKIPCTNRKYKASGLLLLSNKLEDLNFILCFDSIESLSVDLNPIKEMPVEIGQLSNLRYLGIGSTAINSLPQELNLLTQLNYIDISGNKFTNLDATLSQVFQLKPVSSYDLGYLNIEKLPIVDKRDSFSLLSFNGNNKFRMDSNYAFFNTIRYIGKLSLSNTDLTGITSLYNTSIVELDLSYNRSIKNIKQLIVSLKSIKGLKKVNLIGAKLTDKEKFMILNKLQNRGIDFLFEHRQELRY